MIGNSILTPVRAIWSRFRWENIQKRADLHTYWLHPERLPDFVQESSTAMRYLNLLGPLEWDQLPERNLVRDWGKRVISNAAFLASCLIKLEDERQSMGDLLLYLQEHPALRECFLSSRVRLANDQIHANLPDRPQVYRMAGD